MDAWIFLKLFEKGLAYEGGGAHQLVPNCKTGLANEEVKDGRSATAATPP
jgi:leucyl-tRNA synthetase